MAEAVEEQLVNNTDISVKGTNAPTCGQRLTIPNREILKIAFYLKKVGNPTGDVTFTIRKSSDKSLLASKVWGTADTIPTDLTWLEATLAAPVTVNDDVRLLIEHAGYDDANYLLSRLQTSDVKADEFWTRGSVASPADLATWDFVYKYTYYVEGPPAGGGDVAKLIGAGII